MLLCVEDRFFIIIKKHLPVRMFPRHDFAKTLNILLLLAGSKHVSVGQQETEHRILFGLKSIFETELYPVYMVLDQLPKQKVRLIVTRILYQINVLYSTILFHCTNFTIKRADNFHKRKRMRKIQT